MKNYLLVSVAILLMFFLGVTCTQDQATHEHEGHLHFMQQLRKYQSSVSYKEINNSDFDSAQLVSVHADLPDVAAFLTEKRTLDLTSFPCTNCHNQPLAILQADRDPDLRQAHWDIHLIHAANSTMNCTTCHAENNMNSLASLTGEMISLDESFKLCGQCHSTQYRDWQGGAHGKQLNGWKPPRIAKTCVSCHNPHQPAFPKRFPARLNTNQLGEDR